MSCFPALIPSTRYGDLCVIKKKSYTLSLSDPKPKFGSLKTTVMIWAYVTNNSKSYLEPWLTAGLDGLNHMNLRDWKEQSVKMATFPSLTINVVQKWRITE